MPKPKQLIDAVKTATSIHNGDYSSLRGKSFVVCVNIEKREGRNDTVSKPKEERMTLTKLAKEMRVGFSELRQDIKDINVRLDRVENRLDRVEKRLDYNGLKQLPNNK